MHEVRLEVFEGPIDLLLHLITRQRVDIYEVSISTITEEYVRALARMEDLDLETATGFLVVAATLLELKSLRLLPGPQDDEFASRLLEERDLLLARLVECATYREAGIALQVALERGAGYHPRSVGLEEPYLGLLPVTELRFAIGDLTETAARVFEPKPEPELDVSHVRPLTASVREAIVAMTASLRSGSPASFRDLCADIDSRIDVVVRFLGLLELFKSGAISLAQVDRFGDIVARWTGEIELDEVLVDVEEYALAPEAPSAGRGPKEVG